MGAGARKTGRWRGLALGAWLLAGSAWASPQQATPHVSANGLYTIRFAQERPGHCLVEIAKQDGPTTRLQKCVGTVEDLFFVANDGQTFWVIHPVPKVPRGRRYQQRPDRWGGVVVAVKYDRSGKVIGARRLRDFVKGREREKLMDLGLRFGWLAGVSGAPGVAPRVVDGGVVVLDTVADKRYRLRF